MYPSQMTPGHYQMPPPPMPHPIQHTSVGGSSGATIHHIVHPLDELDLWRSRCNDLESEKCQIST
jgi:hypothetical protein